MSADSCVTMNATVTADAIMSADSCVTMNAIVAGDVTTGVIMGADGRVTAVANGAASARGVTANAGR
jgi:mannose/fructose/N-acetylgalactosamine-specific phosphotransferase system component IIC